jgi:hypothetical protein
MNDHGPDEEKAIAAKVALLRQEHQDLDSSILRAAAAAPARPAPDHAA